MMFHEGPPRFGERRGLLLAWVFFFLTAAVILALGYNNWMRQELLRAHRVYWNDLATKAAEGISEEIYAWVMANPDPAVNAIYRFLTEPDSRTEVSMDIPPNQLAFPALLGDLDLKIVECRLSAERATPFFAGNSQTLPAGFNAANEGWLFPDPVERCALLRVQVDITVHGFHRRYEVVREVKSVNPLPGIFGQFTLFVQRKSGETEGDPNRLKFIPNSTPIDHFGGLVDPASPLGTPLTLIHKPSDARRPKSAWPPHERSVPTMPMEWTAGPQDLRDRGWVFLGPLTNNPAPSSLPDRFRRMWVIQPFFGSCTGSKLPSYGGKIHLSYGGGFMLPGYVSLVYNSVAGFLSSKIPPATVNLANDSPFNQDPPHIFQGILVILNRIGWFSGYQHRTDDTSEFGIEYRNFYDASVGATHANEPLDGSILFPMGEILPVPGETLVSLNDRRSPTVILGPVIFRFKQGGKVYQLTKPMADAARIGGEELIQELSSTPAEKRALCQYLPYFPGTGDPFDDLERSPMQWGNPGGWATVAEESEPNREYAAVTWNFHTLVPDAKLYYRLMPKIVETGIMTVYDYFLQDNLLSLKNPRGWIPATHSITVLPSVIQPLDDSGSPVSDTAAEFFYQPRGRGYYGNRMLLQDSADPPRPLAAGNLGALWPFCDKEFDPEQPEFTLYDLRQRTTHLAEDQADFITRFVRVENGKDILDLGGGIVTIRTGGLRLRSSSGGPLFFKDGGMLIVSKGELTLQSPLRRLDPNGRTGITLATAGFGKDIVLDISEPPPGDLSQAWLEAYLLSSGTIRRTAGSRIGLIRGGMAVRRLTFPSDTSLCRGHPGDLFARLTVEWDPVFGCFDPATSRQSLRLHLGPRRSYWKTGPL